MDVFDEIKSKITETAKGAFKKSNELVEVTKLNITIGELKTQLDKIYKDIGKIIYDSYKDGDLYDEEITTKCVQAEEKEEEIDEVKKKLQKLKKILICPECQKENDNDAVFCSKCGCRIINETDD